MKKNLLKQLALVMAASILLTSADMSVLASERATAADTMNVSGNDISTGNASEYSVEESTHDGSENNEDKVNPTDETQTTPTTEGTATDDGTDTTAEELTSEKLTLTVKKYGATYNGVGTDESTVSGFIYTGKAIKPAVDVYYDGVKLKVKKDYVISYKNNVNASNGYFTAEDWYAPAKQDREEQPTIVITGKGKYEGLSLNETFVIFKKVLDSAGNDLTITNLVTNMDVDRTKNREIPVPTVKYKGKALVYGKDFDILISDITVPGVNPEDDTADPYRTTIPAGSYGTGRYYLRLFGNYSNGADKYDRDDYAGGKEFAEPGKIYLGEVCIRAEQEKSLKDAKVVAGSAAKKVKLERVKQGQCTYDLNFGVYDAESKKYYLVENGAVTDKEVKAKDIYTVYLVNEDKTKTYLVYGRDFDIIRRNTYSTNSKNKPNFDIVGIGNYVGVKSRTPVTLVRTKLNTKAITWNSFVSEFEYSGSAKTQVFDKHTGLDSSQVTYSYDGFKSGDVWFYERADFKLTYRNNINAGTASVTITMLPRSGYTGSFTKKFKITKSDIAKTDMDIAIENLFYKAKKPGITVNATNQYGKKLTTADYSVSYKKNQKDGLLTVTVKGKKNYTGTVKREFPLIMPASITESMFTVETSVDYDPEGAKAKVVGTYKGIELKQGTDYKLTYKNNKAAGEASVEITGKGNFYGTVTKTFKINPVPFEKAIVEIDRIQWVYNVKEFEPEVRVTYNGKKLKKGTDYTVTYTNNTQADYEAGTEGTVTVTPIGSFTGSSVVGKIDYFHRLVNNFTVCIAFKKGTNYYTGSQVRPEISQVLHTNLYTTSSMEEGKDYVIEGYGANDSAGNLKGSITIRGINYYGGKATIRFHIYIRKMDIKEPPMEIFKKDRLQPWMRLSRM